MVWVVFVLQVGQRERAEGGHDRSRDVIVLPGNIAVEVPDTSVLTFDVVETI